MIRTTITALATTLMASTALAQATPAGHTVAVNGMDMYYEVSGSGDPLVVLHGAYMNIPSMGAIIPRLAETHTVYALEFQGHGRTNDIDRPITYPNLADDVAAFMDAVGIEKADVFGYSMGAAAGLRLAIDHPEKVDQLVAASVAYDVSGWQPAFTAFIPQMTPDMFAGTPMEEEWKKLAPNPDGFRALAEKLIALESEPMAWEADVKTLTAPVLIIAGDADVSTLEHNVGAVPPARRRRNGRHGQAPRRLAAGRAAGHLPYRRDHPGRVAAWVHRAIPAGRDAQGHVRVSPISTGAEISASARFCRMTSQTQINRAIEATWKTERPRLIAGLARMVRDISMAEELAQDALVAALKTWPRSGVPDNPGAWLMQTAKRRAIDYFRHRTMATTKLAEVTHSIETDIPDPIETLHDSARR